MKFTMQFDMDNAAFDEMNRGYEVSRILSKVARTAYEFNVQADFTGIIKDANGNTVGKYEVVELTDNNFDYEKDLKLN